MPTLYVENIPDDLYESLRVRARERRSSIAAEVIEMIRENVPTPDELDARRRVYERFRRMRAQKPSGRGPFPTPEEMLHEDRER